MTVDTLGLVLFLVGLIFLILELANPGRFLGVVGTTGLVVGLVQMIWPAFLKGTGWSPFAVVGVAGLTALSSVYFYRRFAPAVQVPEVFSSEALVGSVGRVQVSIDPDSLRGRVQIGGLLWSATAPVTIEAGRDARITKVDGAHLEVEPAAQETSTKSGSKLSKNK